MTGTLERDEECVFLFVREKLTVYLYENTTGGKTRLKENTHCLWRCRLDWPNICLDVQAHNPTNQPNERPAQLNVLQEYVG
ncbi:Pentafunctional AROM polypeptide [Dissostichus eleginoides]|uniref:Pentafunctional AROM polypeptide n=1 Tax=Dissostichus eleginoides TaxID=100907 RepID=A0AAD9BG15_DISEL|nr:Pentafunctional AROM polypeptide [Dissostichus eleginoides]